MFESFAKLESAYLQIKHQHQNLASSAQVVILVSNSIDSICALKIIITLLKSDGISHYFLPISTYDCLRNFSQRIDGDESIKTIICINVGGILDISQFLNINSELTNIYILDSHRPLNLHNLYGSNNFHITVFYDENEPEEEGLERARLQEAFQELEVLIFLENNHS